MSRRGTTLVETVVASATFLVMAGLLAGSLALFSRGRDRAGQRSAALVIAEAEMCSGRPEGTSFRTIESDGDRYEVVTQVSPDSSGTLRTRVTVTGELCSVTLERRFEAAGGS
jgi:hypothetical protein